MAAKVKRVGNRQSFGNKCYCCNVANCGKVKGARKTKDREKGYKWLGGQPAKAAWREHVSRGMR